jgi:hypothetical protein
LAEALELIQDLNHDALTPAALIDEAMTGTDSANDLTYRVFYMLRFCGFSVQTIAMRVKQTADNGLDDPITPTQFIHGFGTIPDMAPLRHVASATIKVGPAAAKVVTPFLSHHLTKWRLQISREGRLRTTPSMSCNKPTGLLGSASEFSINGAPLAWSRAPLPPAMTTIFSSQSPCLTRSPSLAQYQLKTSTSGI